MKNSPRAKNAVINVIAGGFGTLIIGILQFVGRIVFIHYLSDDHLGITSLFSNILSVLSVAELGLGTAIGYSLYQPLSEGNEEKIKAIMLFLKRAYFMIGCFILIAGAALIPFLPCLVHTSAQIDHLYLIYVLYLLQSVSSYWFWAYKSVLLQIDQKSYLIKLYQVIINSIVIAVQISLLVIFRNFVLYSVIGLSANVLTNIFTARTVDRKYPYLSEKKSIQSELFDKKTAMKNVLGMSIYRINMSIGNSTDNILISAFINVRLVALYGNYQIVIMGISQTAMQFFDGVTASIGNLFTEDSGEHNIFVFQCVQLLCYWVYTFLGIGILVLINPVIQLCFGSERLLADHILLLQVIYFMINGFQRTSVIYRNACGLFWQGKMRPFFTAILNLVLSIIWVRQFGLSGVILGTIISWLLTTWWYDPFIVYKYVFHKSVLSYFIGYIKATILTIVLAVIVAKLIVLFPFQGVTAFIFKLLIIVVIPNLGYYLIYRKTEEFRYLVKMLKNMIHKTDDFSRAKNRV